MSKRIPVDDGTGINVRRRIKVIRNYKFTIKKGGIEMKKLFYVKPKIVGTTSVHPC